MTGIDTSRGPHFTHTYLCLQAAASGQGVALATNVLIGDYLQAGRLIQPFPHQVKGTYQYYVVCPEATADRPGARRLPGLAAGGGEGACGGRLSR